MYTDIPTLRAMYKDMQIIRQFEEAALALSAEGFYPGSVHTSTGQEAVAVGVRAALDAGDRVLPTYRGHGWAIAAGIPLVPLFAEIAQRAGGVNGGRGGSAYLSSPEHGFFGENSIVGAGVPIGAGVALAATHQGTSRVAVVSIGDGAINQGSVHEGMIFAAAYQLPVVFVVEDNGWSEMTRTSSLLRKELADRGAAYGIAGSVVDGNDPAAVAEAARAAIAAARSGEGPSVLVCRTTRLRGHYNRDIEHYRPKDDVELARTSEPLVRLRERLQSAGVTGDELDAVDAEVAELIASVVREVREMPEPGTADAAAHLYEPAELRRPASPAGESTELTYQRAVNLALDRELGERPEVLVYGEDVGFAGGIFGVTRSLQKKHGAARVFDTPISESAILGSAVGASMEGMRPVVEIMWADFMLVALDQLVNQAANVRYLTQSRLSAPLVVRTQQGATPGSCAQHDQSLEALLAHIPGLRVGLPATPGDAYAMTRAAVASNDPVVLIEARELYQLKGEVYADSPTESLGGAVRRREGGDLTIITWGAVLHRVLDAAGQLSEEGIEATVLDLRWLNPLDDEAIFDAVDAGNGRVLIVHEANLTGGFGAEIASRIQSARFDQLTAPIERLGARDTRLPAAGALQQALVPTASTITDAARRLAKG
ncbi:alpha-ketoacid dehydrogenase subunit alpha/beta [Amycolatopsis pithecellobii]|uniref:dihydrolipoyllysine-residue succinyltransferase n=1 Tax=Amycolatopsis pithecellobii TaxID=664692 RepID=A0A6N7YL33_9PSEU|nr:alpha-ketoacid dehydrogenase subunit alpha/beta [Amycolatopsis pithecellobii]MTD52608.1 transketolase [Amycolatopsis pithecellobii]